MSDYFSRNLVHAMQHRFGSGCKDKQLAAALGIDRSTVNRMRNGSRPLRADRLMALSRYFNVEDDSWWQAPVAFAETLDRGQRAKAARTGSRERFVSMSAIDAHRNRWTGSHAIHRGQYVAYWKAYGIERCYVGSLVEIGNLTDAGMRFSMLNPYIRDDAECDEVRFWRYEGVVYPVAEYLYFYGEQIESSYELFTMIMTASPLSPPDLLRGCLSGIYVKDGQKSIAVNVAVVFAHLSAPMGEWRGEMGRRLGKLRADRVPDRVRRLLDGYPGVIPVT